MGNFSTEQSYPEQWLFYSPLVWGGTASFGGRYRGV